MNVQALGILNNIAIKENGSQTEKVNAPLSFSQVLSEVCGNEVCVNDMFLKAFPANDVIVKAGNCKVSAEAWERNDFPVWKYFQKNVRADGLNNWKPIGAEPTEAEPYIQKELSKVGFGEMVVLIPESLQKKMEAEPEYAQKIMEKLQKWKADYDRMDNALAFSYGDDPVLYQMTKSYCIQLDEDGNVDNYTVISGGMDTRRVDNTKETEKVIPRKIISVVGKKNIAQGINDFGVETEETDYTTVMTTMACLLQNERR